MCRLKNYLPVHILRLLYNSLVLPYLQYGILTWGFKIGRIEKLQKWAVRIITCSKYNAHTEPLFKMLNLLKVSDMLTLNLLKIYYKYKNQSLPFYVMNMFTDAIEPHDYNLRNKYVWTIICCKNTEWWQMYASLSSSCNKQYRRKHFD